ncbi:exonuclease SbcCD subunit D [Reinekea marina]|uniref:Nuclease SbcCD subunit D n=1 Tax=Reinekea marina TaxID=1310421 RepID=A0ABV7WTH4_9GAMM|nr:exonuclease SbcCD subunit D [Reinekea marina]MDN3649132.1 exonuclease SbcCD subunit D [Reinekea marina]
MRILHTSDWHIGRQFHNHNLLVEQQECLDQLIDILVRESIDAVLIAGDIYDRSVPPADAVVLLHRTLSHICLELKIPVVIISGNHDGPERLGFGADLLKSSGLHILTDLSAIETPIQIHKNDQTLNVYGIPYCQPEHVRNTFECEVKTFDEAHSFLVEKITKTMNPHETNLLMSHCFVGGGEESDSERPLSIGGADTVSWRPMVAFDYVALGHLHTPQYRGKETIRYSGSLMKYSFSEIHQNKGVNLITLSKTEPLHVEHLPLSPVRDLRILEGKFDDLLKEGFNDERKEDYLLIRITDKESIIDAIGKLRSIYPNILHLEKTGLVTLEETKQLSKSQLQRSEIELFEDFYQATLDEPLTKAQRNLLTGLIDDLHSQKELS